jgi:hypothetical protein
MAFSRSESRVLFKIGRWIHRALVSPEGLVWSDAIRAPKSLKGSRMAFERSGLVGNADGALHAESQDDRVLVLTRDTGFAAIAEIHFNYDTGPALFGNRGETPIGFVREGF